MCRHYSALPKWCDEVEDVGDQDFGGAKRIAETTNHIHCSSRSWS